MSTGHRKLVAAIVGATMIFSLTAQSAAGANEKRATLSPETFAKARTFIKGTARPLDRALFDFHFAGGSRDAVIAELATFQNKDGGFASNLESDTRWSGSSPLGTMKALRIFNEVQATDKDIHLQSAVRYLLAEFDEKAGRWHALPKEANSAPHAPWWNVSEASGRCEVESPVFPTAAIAGYLQAYSKLLPPGFLQRITNSSLAFLLRAPAQMPMPDIEVLTELVQSLPLNKRTQAARKLQNVLANVVVRDPHRWGTYSVLPLTFVHAPDSPLYSSLADAIPANLDYMITTLQNDGGWGLTWSWESSNPAAWKSAEREWRGFVTLENLKTLKAFHRIAN